MPIKTGLNSLDSLLKGGFPEKASVLLIGAPKSGKTIFGMQYLFQGLINNEYGIYIVTNNFPEELMKGFEKFGKLDEILKKKLIRFVDCYSFHAGIEKENTTFIIRVNGPTALSEIGIVISEIIKQIPKGSKIRVLLDSVSTLLLFNPPKQIANFVQQLNSKIKAANATSVFIVEEGMHDEKDITTLNSLLDLMICLKKEKGKDLIEVTGVGARRPLVYKIENGKIKCR
jgi:KaiC/GvpD/RAD55 family RecA-like ATPase